MNGHDRHSGFGSGVDIALRLDDHEMSIKRFLTYLVDGFNNGEAKGNVRDKDAVHHIAVEPVGLTAVDHVDVCFQITEVGG